MPAYIEHGCMTTSTGTNLVGPSSDITDSLNEIQIQRSLGDRNNRIVTYLQNTGASTRTCHTEKVRAQFDLLLSMSIHSNNDSFLRFGGILRFLLLSSHSSSSDARRNRFSLRHGKHFF